MNQKEFDDFPEIEETELRLEQALQELEIVKQSEEKLLQQNVMECKQAYLYSMRQLQEQFAEQVCDLFEIRSINDERRSNLN